MRHKSTRHLSFRARRRIVSHMPSAVLVLSLLVYLLTMDRSVSWWDCGEFIATGHGLQVGHPPGAPLYQLVSHCFMLLSGGNAMLVAPLSNLVSVLCAGFTAMLLCLTLRLLLARAGYHGRHALAGAVVGTLCYVFCDTAWFSAVESEVYAMAMLFCSLTVWLMLRWEQRRDNRLLPLVGLLLGLGLCVHLMTILVGPMLLWIFMRNAKGFFASRPWQPLVLALGLFLVGLTPYAIVPIRASANPPINEGHPSTAADFGHYLSRDQYEKAPLYPRMWRERDAGNWAEWGGDSPSLWGNIKYCAVYQMGYMYFRYLMYNYIGRENLAYRSDRWWAENSQWAAPGQHQSGTFHGFRYSIFVLPFLLGLIGLVVHPQRRRGDFGAAMMLFLFGGLLLNVYLNHPCYEPRERDYAYVLSFYAFALWIGLGAAEAGSRMKEAGAMRGKPFLVPLCSALLALAPLLMAAGNWADHDRSRCHSVHDIAMAHLQSCDTGAILFTFGDNDTFPLWYLRHAEGQRPDMDILNVNLTGYGEMMRIMADNGFLRPVYLTQFAYDRLSSFYPGRLRCEGFCWRLLPSSEGLDDREPLRRHMEHDVEWHMAYGEYMPSMSRTMMRIWYTNTQIP